MSTEYQKLQSQITWLKNKFACYLTNGCGCTGDSSTDQDNVFKLITTQTVNLTAAEVVNEEQIIINSINEDEQFSLNETNNAVFKVPVIVSSANTVAIYHRYYKLIDAGKGTYGTGSGNTLVAGNLQLERTTEPLTINSTFLLPAQVKSFYSASFASPSVAMNANPVTYTIDITTRDYYFLIYDATRGLETDYKLYRWIGGSGNYGNVSGGGTATVPSDFLLVDTSILETNNDKLTERTININAVINGEGVANDDIAKAVLRSIKGPVYVGPFEIIKFGAIRRTVRTRTDTTIDVTLIYEKYHFKTGDSVVYTGVTKDDFDIEYAVAATSELPTGRTTEPQIIPILNTDLNIPEDALNNNVSPVVIDDATYKTYFVVYNPDGSINDFKIYEFTGADGTYGDGQPDTAVGGDFSLVAQKDVTENIAITRTSQLENDGSSGTSRYVEESDIEVGDGDPPFLREKTVDVNAAQLKTAFSSPVELIATPGAGLGVEIISCAVKFNWGSVAFDANDLEVACSTAIAGDAQFRFDPTFMSNTADAFARMQLKINTAAIQVIENDSVVLRTIADSVATGDSTIRVFIIYRIIQLT